MRGQRTHREVARDVEADALVGNQHVDAVDLLEFAQGRRDGDAVLGVVAQGHLQRRGGEADRADPAADFDGVGAVQLQRPPAYHLADFRVPGPGNQLPEQHFRRIVQVRRFQVHIPENQVGHVPARQVYPVFPAFGEDPVPVRGLETGFSRRQGRRRFPFLFPDGGAARQAYRANQRGQQAYRLSHHQDAPSFGKETTNSEPFPGSLFTEMLPPCIFTICRTMLSPRPVPPVSRLLALSTR